MITTWNADIPTSPTPCYIDLGDEGSKIKAYAELSTGDDDVHILLIDENGYAYDFIVMDKKNFRHAAKPRREKNRFPEFGSLSGLIAAFNRSFINVIGDSNSDGSGYVCFDQVIHDGYVIHATMDFECIDTITPSIDGINMMLYYNNRVIDTNVIEANGTSVDIITSIKSHADLMYIEYAGHNVDALELNRAIKFTMKSYKDRVLSVWPVPSSVDNGLSLCIMPKFEKEYLNNLILSIQNSGNQIYMKTWEEHKEYYSVVIRTPE